MKKNPALPRIITFVTTGTTVGKMILATLLFASVNAGFATRARADAVTDLVNRSVAAAQSHVAGCRSSANQDGTLSTVLRRANSYIQCKTSQKSADESGFLSACQSLHAPNCASLLGTSVDPVFQAKF